MTLSEIIQLFRVENPEITTQVVSDVLLKKWCIQGDKEVCALTRCIVGDSTIVSVASSSVYDTKYDLEAEIDKFFDIDDFPGGGVSFDDEPLEKTTVAELDKEDSSWRTRSAGTPEKWYRRGKFLYFDYPVSTADLEIRVYTVLVSDDFVGDDTTPYNQLSHLELYHYGINKYLQWKAKAKVGKPNEAQAAQAEFLDYAKFMKSQIGGNKYSPIRVTSKEHLYHNPNSGR
jgi:hypothetical protein